jgi:hypothetical protein
MLIKTNATKKFLTPKLPPLRMAIKNKFGRHRIGDQNFLVVIHVVTKNFQLLIL